MLDALKVLFILTGASTYLGKIFFLIKTNRKTNRKVVSLKFESKIQSKSPFLRLEFWAWIFKYNFRSHFGFDHFLL